MNLSCKTTCPIKPLLSGRSDCLCYPGPLYVHSIFLWLADLQRLCCFYIAVLLEYPPPPGTYTYLFMCCERGDLGLQLGFTCSIWHPMTTPPPPPPTTTTTTTTTAVPLAHAEICVLVILKFLSHLHFHCYIFHKGDLSLFSKYTSLCILHKARFMAPKNSIKTMSRMSKNDEQ